MIDENGLEKIENEEVNQLPRIKFQGRIEIIESIVSFNKLISEIAINNILGFDTETRPSFKKGRSNKVSLLQLASFDVVYLIRINHIGLPKGLRRIFENQNILKVGLAIHDDIKSLQKIAKFSPSGFIDLQKLAEKNGIGELGLRKMSAIVLNGKLSKNEQLSNWENESLTNKQMIYAATDAWVSLKIFNSLKIK